VLGAFGEGMGVSEIEQDGRELGLGQPRYSSGELYRAHIAFLRQHYPYHVVLDNGAIHCRCIEISRRNAAPREAF
jgi:hypothetical protein